MPSAQHIWWKCFRFYPCKKIWQFSTKRGYDNTHFLYSYVAMHFSVHIPHTIQVWGLVIVYSFQGFVRTSCQINESQLHTFYFLTNPPHRRWYGNKLNEMKNLNFCPKCGWKVEGDPKFCPQCGGSLSNDVQPESLSSKLKWWCNEFFESSCKKSDWDYWKY